MTPAQDYRLFLFGALSGLLGTICYIAVALFSLSHSLTYILAMAWPILSVIFVFSLYRYIALTRQSPANQLAFVFAALAFTMVAAMISIQLGIQAGMERLIAESPGQGDTLTLIKRSTRLVDIGLDVAWDLFIGTALIFLCFALARNNQFGFRWGIPALLLALLLIVLNVLTFPWPPGEEGLIDVGPAIGLYIIALSIRLLQLALKMQR
jgi:hypothetical protein